MFYFALYAVMFALLHSVMGCYMVLSDVMFALLQCYCYEVLHGVK